MQTFNHVKLRQNLLNIISLFNCCMVFKIIFISFIYKDLYN